MPMTVFVEDPDWLEVCTCDHPPSSHTWSIRDDAPGMPERIEGYTIVDITQATMFEPGVIYFLERCVAPCECPLYELGGPVTRSV